MKKKLIVLLFVAFIFVGCRKPIITLVDQEPPSGYSKVFLLEDNYFTKFQQERCSVFSRAI